MLFTRAGNRTDCTLALDNHATVDNAYVDLTLRGTRSNSRPDPFDPTPDAFPVDPWLDVSANGTKEWSFDSSRFGPLGHTTKFSDGSSSSSVVLGENGSYSLSFDVPSQAEIVNATITMSCDPQPYLAHAYQLTDNNWSDGEEGLLAGDTAHHPWQMAHLDWSSTADSDPRQSAETRRELFSRFADTPTLVIGGHFSAGHIRRKGDAFSFVPVG